MIKIVSVVLLLILILQGSTAQAIQTADCSIRHLELDRRIHSAIQQSLKYQKNKILSLYSNNLISRDQSEESLIEFIKSNPIPGSLEPGVFLALIGMTSAAFVLPMIFEKNASTTKEASKLLNAQQRLLLKKQKELAELEKFQKQVKEGKGIINMIAPAESSGIEHSARISSEIQEIENEIAAIQKGILLKLPILSHKSVFFEEVTDVQQQILKIKNSIVETQKEYEKLVTRVALLNHAKDKYGDETGKLLEHLKAATTHLDAITKMLAPHLEKIERLEKYQKELTALERNSLFELAGGTHWLHAHPKIKGGIYAAATALAGYGLYYLYSMFKMTDESKIQPLEMKPEREVSIKLLESLPYAQSTSQLCKSYQDHFPQMVKLENQAILNLMIEFQKELNRLTATF